MCFIVFQCVSSRFWLAARHVSDFDDAKLDLLEEVLELENPDLFKWFTKQAKDHLLLS